MPEIHYNVSVFTISIVGDILFSQELLKYTNPEHNDYDNVKSALEAMREVASSINEKKRQVENIKKIAEWQLAIEQWEVSTLYIISNKSFFFLLPLRGLSSEMIVLGCLTVS